MACVPDVLLSGHHAEIEKTGASKIVFRVSKMAKQTTVKQKTN